MLPARFSVDGAPRWIEMFQPPDFPGCLRMSQWCGRPNMILKIYQVSVLALQVRSGANVQGRLYPSSFLDNDRSEINPEMA